MLCLLMNETTANKLENAPTIWVPTTVIPLRIRKYIKPPMDPKSRQRSKDIKPCSFMQLKAVSEFDFDKFEVGPECEDSF